MVADAGLDVADGAGSTRAAQLPVIALSRPRDTLELVEPLLDESDDPLTRCFAGQARGIALRELGRVNEAISQLRATAAECRGGDPNRLADVLASLAVTLAVAGQSEEALGCLEQARELSSGLDAARVQVRYGSMLGELGRPVEAATELRRAASALREGRDETWEARALLNLAMACVEVGDTPGAERALARAEVLLVDAEQVFEAASARQFRALTAMLEGRIPAALAHLDVAEERLSHAGTQLAEVEQLKALALQRAGLLSEALVSAERAVETLLSPGGSAAHLADAKLLASRAALGAGALDRARRFAAEAGRLYIGQRRTRGATLARLVDAQAAWRQGDLGPSFAREVRELAVACESERTPEATVAHLLAAEVTRAQGELEACREELDNAARGRDGPLLLERVHGWHAVALRAVVDGNVEGALDACDRALSVLEEHQSTLGSFEARAAATTHGLAVASLAVDIAVGKDDPELMLRWVERWRATAGNAAAVTSPEFTAELAQLRLLRHRLENTDVEDDAARTMRSTASEIESRLRRRAQRYTGVARRGEARSGKPHRPVTDIQDDTVVLSLFGSQDRAHVVVRTRAGTTHHVAGSFAKAYENVKFLNFALRRTARPSARSDARDDVARYGRVVQEELLGAVVDQLAGKPVVIVPPARFASLPWGALPALTSCPFTLAPSVATWTQARKARAAHTAGRVVLVAGPRLAESEGEVERLAGLYPQAVRLSGAEATAEAVLTAFEGASVAHVAAHGTFRPDNPLLSSLALADGPLTVYDMQQLERAPATLVMSSCDTGGTSAVGADEMLGVASVLLPVGTAAVVGSVLPVPDAGAANLAYFLHSRLVAHVGVAQALRDARAVFEDPPTWATTRSFVCFGAG